MKLTDDPSLDELPGPERAAFVMTLACPSCGRGPGSPCLSMNGNRPPVDLGYQHRRRVDAAKTAYRLHRARPAAARP